MKAEDKIRGKNLPYDINTEVANISALPSCKIDNYEYLSDEEILSPYQIRMIERTRFICSPLEKAL